jgi:ketosteroid isomerase-like protein
MFTHLCRMLPAIALILIAPAWVCAQESASSTDRQAETELREAIRLYDDALRRADVAAAERFWADEYVFINPRGERVSRKERVANLREKRTSFGSLAHEPKEETIHTYMDGNLAVYTTLLTIDGRYSGEAERGEFRALVVWIRRDGRWQQLASQMTPILKPSS